jgi:hypothetical protein
MENYNFEPEDLDNINDQKSDFFAIVAEQVKNLVELGVLKYEKLDSAEKSFWKVFTKNHQEIRSDEKLIRHFALKKKDKLAKELKTPLFASDIYGDLPEHVQKRYWNLILGFFLVFELHHKDKSDIIINTLVPEIEKGIQELAQAQAQQLVVLSQSSDQVQTNDELGKKLRTKLGRQAKARAPGSNPALAGGFDMSKLNSMMSSFGLDPSNPDSLDPSKLMGVMSKMMGSLDSGEPGSNPLEQLGLDGDMKNLDMGSLLTQLMPGVTDSANQNLMQVLKSDITGTMGNLESADQVFEMTKKLGEKYQNMISSGQVDPTEIVGSLMGLMTDKQFTDELSKIDISKIKPEDMVTKMLSEVSPEMLGQLTGGSGLEGLDLGNIGSLVAGLAGSATGSTQAPTNLAPEPELTPEQLKELEEYYSRIQVESQPELD